MQRKHVFICMPTILSSYKHFYEHKKAIYFINPIQAFHKAYERQFKHFIKSVFKQVFNSVFLFCQGPNSAHSSEVFKNTYLFFVINVENNQDLLELSPFGLQWSGGTIHLVEKQTQIPARSDIPAFLGSLHDTNAILLTYMVCAQ